MSCNCDETRLEILRKTYFSLHDIRRYLENIKNFQDKHFTLEGISDDYCFEMSDSFKRINIILDKMFVKNLKGLISIAKSNMDLALSCFPHCQQTFSLCSDINHEKKRIEEIINRRI